MRRNTTKICRRLSASLLLQAILVAALAADISITIDTQQRAQTFEGWGTSLCWWADRVGDWPDEKLDPLLKLLADPNDGLGFTIYRYNIGGGDDPSHKHHRAGAAIPGFKPTEDGPYDWSADAKQRRVLDKLLKLTKDPILEAFSLSPPYWMTQSGCTAGAVDGGSNIKPDYFDAYADYITEVIKHFRDECNIVFRTVEPMNEANADWWKAKGAQEGCHLTLAEQERLIQAVDMHLKKKGLRRTGVSAPDSNSIDTCVSNIKAYSHATIAALTQINTHSYYGDKRQELRDLASKHNKRLWQSESGPLFFTGTALETQLFMAERIVRDITEMQVDAWIDWQFMAGLHWGCTDWVEQPQEFKVKKKLYFYAQFSRFIRPGDQILKVSAPHVLAACSKDGHRVSIVIVNSEPSAKTYRIALRNWSNPQPAARIYRTSANEECDRLEDLNTSDNPLQIVAAPQSVTTVILPSAATTQRAKTASPLASRASQSDAQNLAPIKSLLLKAWPHNRTINIVCHGHSVPAGYFRTPHVATFSAYPHLFHRHLKSRYPQAVINVIVTAIGGEHSASGAKRFERDVLSHQPDLIMIDYALNDRSIGLTQAQAAWTRMILLAKAQHIPVILLTPTPDLNADWNDPNDPLLQQAAQVRQLATQHGVLLIDSLQLFRDHVASHHVELKSLMAQSNHPNQQGHGLIAATLADLFAGES